MRSLSYVSLYCSVVVVVVLVLLFSVDPAASQNACYQPKDTGPCRASIPRFYYNSRSGRCDTFNWGGCEGNQNNFRSLGECHSFRRYCLRRRGFS